MSQPTRPASSLRRSGVVVRFRLHTADYQHLLRIALREEMSLSEAIRDALYEQHGIGELVPVSSQVPPSGGPTPA